VFLDDRADFICFIVHDREMEGISNESISNRYFIAALRMVEVLCFSVRFSRDISGSMCRIERIPEKVSASDAAKVVLMTKVNPNVVGKPDLRNTPS